jgi:LuxR family maltose regulon positive regulatory protein
LNAGLQQNGGFARKLTLISAPAGFGKTTLLSEWIADLKTSECSRLCSVSWLSLDEGDNDLIRWFSYLIAALQTTNQEIGKSAAGMLPAPQLPQTETVINTLLNEIAAVEQNIILVLDDYHLINAQLIHQSLTYLLDHLPKNLHLVIATRADPPIPLSRLRASRQLLELREHDLRFTYAEATALLNQIMDLNLPTQDIRDLEARTEGWIAGLQLAVLAMQGNLAKPEQADKHAFIQSFTGSNRFILDYLGEEVLNQQTEEVQVFLLQTSILDRLTAPLCDYLIIVKEISDATDAHTPSPLPPAPSSQDILDYLEHTNLFLIPLDDQREWYRYHTLFADLLRKRLETTWPELVPSLHQRASQWFSNLGFIAQAIDHALAAEDFSGAADLIEGVTEATMMRSQLTTFLHWVEGLPEEVLLTRPLLCAYQSWAMLVSGQPLGRVEARLKAAEDADSAGLFTGEVTAFRAMIAALQGNAALSIELSHQALEIIPNESLFLRSIVADNLGITHLLQGDIEAAIHYLNEAAKLGQEVGNVMSAVAALSNLAGLCMVQGQLRKAETIYLQALEYATDEHGDHLPIAGKALLGLGELAREWNDLDTAWRYINEGLTLFGQYGEIGSILGYISLARIKQGKGDLKAAHNYVNKARQLAVSFDTTDMDDLLVDTCEIWLWLIEGKVEAADQWARARGLYEHEFPKTEDDPSYLDIHELELAVLARLYVNQGKIDRALVVLQPLLQAARQTGRIRSVIRLMAQQSVAYFSTSDEEQALSILSQALSLAEPEGFVRTFLDEGEMMVQLLYLAMERDIEKEYIGKLLASVELPAAARQPTAIVDPSSGWIEPLSRREIEVLQLIAEGLTNREIADRLVISLSTVKGHTAKIYGKLNVNSRTQAVAKARQLGLLPQG